MSSPVHFYDATNPRNVPSGAHAAIPIDGRFAPEWEGAQTQRMGKVFFYTVLGGTAVAHHARGIDIEAGDRANDPGFYMPFLIERTKHYGDATPYCNRSTLPSVQSHCRRAGILDKVLFWVATLDGTIVKGAWATQIHGGIDSPFDLSVLQGVDNFHRP